MNNVWKPVLLCCAIGLLPLVGCAEFAGFVDQLATPSSSQTDEMRNGITSIEPDAAPATPTPEKAPTLDEVKDALASTKTLLEDQEERVRSVLELKAEVNQELRAFRAQDLTPLQGKIEVLTNRVDAWETATDNDQVLTMATMQRLTDDLIETQQRGTASEQRVTALADHIEQDRKKFEQLFADYQTAMVGFKAVMEEIHSSVLVETTRATEQEQATQRQLHEQAATVQHLVKQAEKMEAFDHRLTQLHAYMNTIRKEAASMSRAVPVSHQTGTQEGKKVGAMLSVLTQRLKAAEERQAASEQALHQQIQVLTKRLESETPHRVSQGKDHK